MRHITLGAVLISIQLAASPQGAWAGGHEPTTVAQAEESQELADRAQECLRRGEEALTEEAKLAAYREGLDLALRAVALDDENADAHFAIFGNRGRIMLLEGATVNPLSLLKVNKELNRTLDLDPNHADALASRGGLYRQLPWILGGSLTKAESFLNQAITLNPQAVRARIELAATYRDMGQPERGVALLETAANVAREQGRFRHVAEARMLLEELRKTR